MSNRELWLPNTEDQIKSAPPKIFKTWSNCTGKNLDLVRFANIIPCGICLLINQLVIPHGLVTGNDWTNCSTKFEPIKLIHKLVQKFSG